MIRYLMRRACWAALVAAFCLVADYARAQAVFARAAAVAVPSSRGWAVSSAAADAGFGQFMQRSITASSEGAAEFSKLLVKPHTGMATSAFEASIQRTMSASAITKAARALDGPAVVATMAAGLIFDAVTGERWYGTPDGWMRDPGVAPTTGGGTTQVRDFGCRVSQHWATSYEPTIAAACANAASVATQATPVSYRYCNRTNSTTSTTYSFSYVGFSGNPAASAGVASIRVTASDGCDGTSISHVDANWNEHFSTVSGTTTCPASVDALNPALSVPAGAAPMADGKCRTGRYTAGSAADFQEMGERKFKGAVGAAMAEAILNTPGAKIDAPPGTLSGPSSIEGPTEVTTTPAPGGGVTTTTTKDEWRLGYQTPGNITRTPERTITVCPPEGPCETTIERTPLPVGGTETTTPDYCLEHPERVGCQELEDPGDDKPEWAEKEVPWEVVDLGLPAACPADQQFTIRTWVLPLRWQPACDAAVIIAPGIKALASLSALIFVVANIKA